MSALELEALCTLIELLNPWPLGKHNEGLIKGFANAAARDHGFTSWQDARNRIRRWSSWRTRVGLSAPLAAYSERKNEHAK